MSAVLLQTKINFENAYEDSEVIHPLSDLTMIGIQNHFNEIKKKYPGYDDYEYVLAWESHGFGAMTGWYDLYGIKY